MVEGEREEQRGEGRVRWKGGKDKDRRSGRRE